MKNYFVIAKKWRDKTYGNTYFNAKVIDTNGKTLLYTGFQYGYSNQYYHEAKTQLTKIEKNGFNLIDLGCDYTLQKVLKNNLF